MIIVYVLHIRMPKIKTFNLHTQCYTDNKHQCGDLNPGSLNPETMYP